MRGTRSSRSSPRSRSSTPLLSRGDAGMPPPVQLPAGDRRPRRSADGTGAAAPRRRDRTGGTAIAAGLPTPADARAFLQMARQPRHGVGADTGRKTLNPIATAYFRAVEEEAESTQEGDSPSAREMRHTTRRQTFPRPPRFGEAGAPRHSGHHRGGHRTADRGWRDAGTAARAARSRRRRPSSRETPAPEAADGVRHAPRRDRVPHAQS